MPEQPRSASKNYQFLHQHDPLLVKLCLEAKRISTAHDANTDMLRFRQFGESSAQRIGPNFKIDMAPDFKQAKPLAIFKSRGHLPDHPVVAFISL